MKLSWKLFFATMPFFILCFTGMGAWVIQDGFQKNLQQEIQRYIAENHSFRNSYELTCHSLSEEQMREINGKELVESFYRHEEKDNAWMRVYSDTMEVLYQDAALRIPHEISGRLTGEQNTGYELVEQQEKTYLVVMGLTGSGRYVETTADISSLYADRSQQYARYRRGMVLGCLVTGCISFLVISLVMRKVQMISGAVRRFSDGQYEVRAGIKGRDEIGRLAEDFNWMADVMCSQMEELQKQVERQEEFTSAFAHELKTPMTSVIGYADLLRQVELTKEERDVCVNYIYEQGRRLQSLSHKLLELTLAGREELVIKEIPVRKLLQDVQKTAEPLLLEKEMILEIQAEEGMIYGDADLLSVVFLNFLDNARKASENGQCIRVRGKTGVNGYQICVEDEGRGIPEESLGRITEAFYMADKSRSRKEGGAGLGLALCSKILALHQVQWKIESRLQEGTKITVWFPDGKLKKQERKRHGKTDVG